MKMDALEFVFSETYKLNTAVLFLVFNRLDPVVEVFEVIRQMKPPRFYIAADGARENISGEVEKVKVVRDYIISNIDWDCEVKTLFREKNLSCGPSVKNAIDWFFDHEEKGIILEDDTKPNKSFFRFCEELLNKYSDDNRIGLISGNNHIKFEMKELSYTFSKFYWTWGWATWRRAWQNMDFEMSWQNTQYNQSIIKNMGYSKKSILHWQNNIESIKTNSVNAWDYQWFLSLSTQNQLCIFPSTNLVSNIGFGEDATHTFGFAPKKYTKQEEIQFPLNHPKYILPLEEFEKIYESTNVHKPQFWKKYIPKIVKNRIKRIMSFFQ